MKTKTTTLASKKKALLARSLLEDKKAEQPLLLDLRKLTLMCDFFVICHGTSPVNIRGLTDNLLEEFEKHRLKPEGMEGYENSEWVLVDFGDVVVHIFSEESREFYALEKLWGDAPQIIPGEESR